MNASAVRRLLVASSLTAGTTAVYLIEAFKALGCELRVVSDLAHPLADVRANGVFDVRRWTRASGFSPDAFVFVEGGTRRLFPCAMEELGCPTAWYAIDTHVHLELHLRTARLFDLSFVAQREYLERFGPAPAHWVPLAAPEGLGGTRFERDVDIAFVGSDNAAVYPERARLLAAIRERYPSTLLGRASPEDIGRIYGRAKVVFNKSVRNDVNMRYFEAMCAGAVLVTDRIRGNGVAELFEPGADFLEYESESSLIEVLDRVLSDDAARARIGERARRTVLERHTYRHRAAQMLQALRSARHETRPGPADYLPVYHGLRFPDGVLREAARSLAAIRRAGDRNPVLGVVSAVCAVLGAALVAAYRLRYRLRYWRLARRPGQR